MNKYYYIIWKGHNGEDKAILLEDEPVFITRRNAFRRAKHLADQLPPGCEFYLLVRRVSLYDDTCLEWKFEPTIRAN